MRIDYTDNVKGVVIADINGTINTMPYFDNKDLLRLLKSCGSFDTQIVDFEKKCTYLILNREDLDRVERDYIDNV